MLKKWLCILVILSALLTLPACSRNPVSSSGTAPTQMMTAPTEGSVPPETAEGTLPEQNTPTTIPVENTETQPTMPPATKPASQPETETVPQPETQPAPETQPTPTEPIPTVPPAVEPAPVPTYGHTPLPASEYYQYTNMTAGEKQLYNKLVTAIENLQNKVAVSDISIKANAALALFHRVLADNPQFFWVSRKISVVYDPRTQNVETFVIQYTDGERADTVSGNNQPVAVADRAKIAAKRKALEDKIAQILNTIPANYPEVEREKLIHDYITANVRYDTVAASNPNPVDAMLPHAYDIYGAAIEGNAVCEGYAKLFQYLCYRTGINATQISGTANGGHMWNAVRIEGDWYEMDVTWDDTDDGVPYYAFFNLTHQEMSQTHLANTSEMSYPQCNGTKYRYADYYALKALSATQVSENYKIVVDRLITAGSGYLILYKNGVNVNGEALNALAYNDSALIHQYARSRGYRLELARSYTTYEDFVYIAYTAKKL